MENQNRKNKTRKAFKGKAKYINDDRSERSMYPKIVSMMPKELTATPVWQYVRRYLCASAVSSSLTINDLNNSAIMASTTVVGFSLNRATRIKRIRIWCPLTTQGTSVTVTLTPSSVDSANNSFIDFPKTISDTTISIDRPAYIDYRPDLNHPSGSWHIANTVNINLMSIVAPIGSIIDLHLESILNFSNTQSGYAATLVGATAGQMYVRTILGSAIPVGVNTI